MINTEYVSQFFAFQTSFREVPWKITSFWRPYCCCWAPVTANAVASISTVAGVPAVAGLPSAVDVCDVYIVPAAANPTVSNNLQ